MLQNRNRRMVIAMAVTMLIGVSMTSCRAGQESWHQWGGPERDFTSKAVGLAQTWPTDGPPKLWSRDLGAGYSGIVTDGKTLFTMYRDGKREVVIALEAATGRTKWMYPYVAALHDGQVVDYGEGPNATPLLIDGKLVTIGFTGKMHCLNAADGQVLWTHDLMNNFGSKVQEFGYASSPMSYRGQVIVLVGGEKTGVVALNPTDGSVSWKSEPLDISYASPIVIHVDGQDQVVFMASTEVIGIDAHNGHVEWRWPCVNRYKNNCSQPIWGPNNMLWVTTQQDGGTRMLRLSRKDGKTSVREVWSDDKIRHFHWNAMWVGDYIYGTSGDTATPLMAIEAKTGKVAWRRRGFAKAKMLHADGKLILLDENGRLGLVKATPTSCTILNNVHLLDKVAWTPPTLVGTTLYLRDTKRIMALDLGPR